jgi:hypothetical protein
MRDFEADATDDKNREAEELVGRWLRERYDAEIIDMRDMHLPYDWAVRWGFTLDVKTSRWMDRENRVHYEIELRHANGKREPGWSVKPDPQFVVYVNRRTFEAHLISMREWRLHVQDRLWHAEEQGRDKPDGWIWSESPSRSRTGQWVTLAWSIPLDELREAGLVWMSWPLRSAVAA